MTIRWNKQTLVLTAIVLVVALLLYTYFSTGRKVLDASNDADLAKLFDQLNPQLSIDPRTGAAAGAAAGAALGGLGLNPIIQPLRAQPVLA